MELKVLDGVTLTLMNYHPTNLTMLGEFDKLMELLITQRLPIQFVGSREESNVNLFREGEKIFDVKPEGRPITYGGLELIDPSLFNVSEHKDYTEITQMGEGLTLRLYKRAYTKDGLTPIQ